MLCSACVADPEGGIMSLSRRVLGLAFCVGLVSCAFTVTLFAGQEKEAAPAPQVATAAPRWIQFSGVLKDATGTNGPGVAGITFALYKDQGDDAAPLWLETQNILV